jgi:polyketide synthase PksN
VGYLEAHGTGTALGDPIEITGLSQAFASDTSERQFCAIGSVKTNIGHLEAAAGIAGVSKLVLQLMHGERVPSLHAVEPNPNIDFATTPFVVQQRLEAWPRPVREGREGLRIGGVSSFGAGGANAHVLLQEYVAPAVEPMALSARHPALLVLSAKTEERLGVVVERLLASLRSGRFGDGDLAAIAYTLQVGREAMEERLGLTAASLAEAVEKLQAYASGGGSGVAGLYRGQARRSREALSVFDAEDLQPTLAGWLARGRYGKWLALWVKGMSVDWALLYPDARPQIVRLPAYPFEAGRYWLPHVDSEAVSNAPSLHPLVQRNTSGLLGLRYTSNFSGREPHFLDTPDGRRELPTVVQLELVRVAIALAADVDTMFVELDELQWGAACVVDGPLRVDVAIHASEYGIAFELISDANGVLLCGNAIVRAGSDAMHKSLGPDEASHALQFLTEFQEGRLDLDEIERLIDAGLVV